MKRTTLAYIAAQVLSKKEKEDLAKVFRQFDKNSDGKLSTEEV